MSLYQYYKLLGAVGNMIKKSGFVVMGESMSSKWSAVCWSSAVCPLSVFSPRHA